MSKKKKKKKREGNPRGAVLAMMAVAVTVAVVVSVTQGSRPVAEQTIRVVAEMPHDPNAFTQGFLYHDGFFYESTGLRGQSTVRKVIAETGRVIQRHDLEEQYFGEGLALWEDKLYQLTFEENTLFVYEAANLRQIREIAFEGEGWGLTHDDTHLIMSNGSDRLFFRDPESFEIVRELPVEANGQPVSQLNELEYIEGEIWANVWGTKKIVRIDARSGRVTSEITLFGLPQSDDRTGNEDTLNGIAYDKVGQRIFVTGKRYTRVYQIEIVDEE